VWAVSPHGTQLRLQAYGANIAAVRTSSAAERVRRAARGASRTLLILCIANFLSYANRQVIAALAPLLKQHWQLTDTQVGLLGTAFELTYSLGAVPVAIVADRWLRRKIVSLAVVVWSAATGVAGSSASYPMLLLGRAGLGLGEAGYGPSALAWLSDIYSPDRRSRAVGLHDLGLMLGAAAGYVLGGVLGERWGWRLPLFVLALPGFLVAAVIWLQPDARRGGTDLNAVGVGAGSVPRTLIPARAMITEALRAPTLRAALAAGVLQAFVGGGLAHWLPTFAVRFHGFSEGAAGIVTGGVAVGAGALGVLSGGVLGDALTRYWRSGRLLLIGASFVIGFPLALGAALASDRTAFLVLAFLAVYLFTLGYPCMGPLVHQVVRPNLRATAFAVYLLAIHLLGDATAPAVIGWLSDRTGDLRLALASVVTITLFGGLVAMWGTRFVARDEDEMMGRLQGSGQE
jgi:MFS family permease